MAKLSEIIALKQKKLYALILGGIVIIVGGLIFWMSDDDKAPKNSQKQQFDAPSKDIKPENIRLASIEQVNDVLSDRLQALEKSFINLKEEKIIVEAEKGKLADEKEDLRMKVQSLQYALNSKPSISETVSIQSTSLLEPETPNLKVWEPLEKNDDRNVLFEIPAGTVVKAILVSGADCSVAVQKPTGPNMVLLRPLDNGKLPRNIRVPLKGSVIIGNAIGDIASERVYIRAERMTLVDRGGSFTETELTAYVSGEDGREGLRGVVVDRSGQIITRAAFASFLSGVSQTVQATLNNQTIEKLAGTNKQKTILDIDLYRNSAFQGGATALDKLSEYYIRRAEQLQPAIQIAAGRVVDVIFTKTVRIGERDLKKKFDKEREAKLKQVRNG